MNGDGYDDLIIGAPPYSNGQFEEGAVAILYGSASPDSTPALWIESNQASAWFGYSVSGAGDVNGDGYGDVLVGAPFYTSGTGYEGRAFVYLRIGERAVDDADLDNRWLAIGSLAGLFRVRSGRHRP